jgi:hypothetical protein
MHQWAVCDPWVSYGRGPGCTSASRSMAAEHLRESSAGSPAPGGFRADAFPTFFCYAPADGAEKCLR